MTTSKEAETIKRLKEDYGFGGELFDHLEGAEQAIDFLIDYLKAMEPNAKMEIETLEAASQIMSAHKNIEEESESSEKEKVE